MPRAMADGPGKRYTLSSRLTYETQNALKEAARLSGRSVSQEAEFRLERSLAEDRGERDKTKDNLVAKALLGDDDTEEMLRAFAAAIGAAMSYTGKHWKDDVYTRGAVQASINAVRARHFGSYKLGLSAADIDHDRLQRAIDTGTMFGKVLVAARLDPDVAAWIESMGGTAQAQAELEAEAVDFARAAPEKKAVMLSNLFGVEAA